MSEPAGLQDPQRVAKVRRRIGFVAALWWVAAVSGGLCLVQGLHAGWARLLFIGFSWLLAIFFSFAWWQLHKGRLP